MFTRRALVSLTLALAACSPSPVVPPTRPGASRSPVPVPGASSSGAPAVVPSIAASVVAVPTTAPLIAPAANLTGLVLAPAHLVSNNGGNLISDHGMGIVSNNGGAYRLTAAVAQIPVPNHPIELLDATGKPLAS